ncbi:MAG: hypothetical protein E7378_01920 [Clostridiales bacterium]|nr:hypothetical protein [Clostridiales bacterium]
MRKIIFDKNEYESYKSFYDDLCKKLNKDRFLDWKNDYDGLCYRGDFLYEFLCYCAPENNTYIFKNFDIANLKPEKKFEDFQWSIVFKIFESFVKEYPNNQLEFI